MQDVLLVVFCNVSDLLHYVSSHIIVKTTITLLIVDNKHHRTPLPRTRAKLPRKPKGRFVAREAARHVPLEAAVWFWTPSVSEPGRGGIGWIWSRQEWCCCFPGEGLHSCGKRSLPGVPGGLIGPQKPAPNITEKERVAATVCPSVPMP